jgi:hypothetical protein
MAGWFGSRQKWKRCLTVDLVWKPGAGPAVLHASLYAPLYAPDPVWSVKLDTSVTRHISLGYISLKLPMSQSVFGPIVPDTTITTLMAANYSADIGLFNVEAEMASLLRDMNDEELCSFAELQEEPANDDQIELYIYICFLIFTRTYSTEHLQQAIRRIEGWITEVPIGYPDRARRFQILDMTSAWMSQIRIISEDVENMVSRNR